MGQRQGAARGHAEDRGHGALTSPRAALEALLAPLGGTPRLIDAPAHAPHDAAIPVADDAHADAIIGLLRGDRRVETVERGPRPFVNIRFSASAFLDVATALSAQAEGLPPPHHDRTWRRVTDFLRMAAREHGQAVVDQQPLQVDETRPLLALLERALSTRRSDVRHRALAQVRRQVDIMYAERCLLRGEAACIIERAWAMQAVGHAVRWIANASPQPGESPPIRGEHGRAGQEIPTDPPQRDHVGER